MEKMKPEPMIIYLIDFDEELLKWFFDWDCPKWQKKENSSNRYKEYEFKGKKNEKEFYDWKAYIYEKKDLLKEDIIKNYELNQVILIFGINSIDEFLIEDCEVEIGIISENNYSENKGELNRYLTNIKYDKENMKKTINKIYKYLHERNCYFNQIENKVNESLIDFSINILLTGISRMGKSTFINLISRKLVSKANDAPEPVTTKINEYIIYKRIEKKNIGIKFYDTPGLTEDKKEENKNAINLIKNKLSKETDSSKEINLIYFFLNDSANLANHLLFFQFLIDINKERKKQNLKGIPLIFVFNKNSKKVNKVRYKSFLTKKHFWTFIY